MSEQKFKESRSELAFSQQLVDQLRQQNMPQQGQEMPEEPMGDETLMEEATEAPAKEPKEEQGGIIEAVKSAVQPMIDEVKALFTKKQEVEIKIDGEMRPKEDDDNGN